jgi:uncharacterized membrane protein required for colicin V production
MNWLDLVFAIIVLTLASVGYTRGTLRSCLSLVALLVAVWISGRVAPESTKLISNFLGDTELTGLIAFLVVFGALFLLIDAVGNFLMGFLAIKGEGVIDRVGGIAAGVLIGLVVVQLAVTLLGRFPFNEAVTMGVNESAMQVLLDNPQWNAMLWLLDTDARQIKDLFQAH